MGGSRRGCSDWLSRWTPTQSRARSARSAWNAWTIAFIVATAKIRPGKLGRPFTHWSVRKLAAYLAENPHRAVRIGRERLRQLLRQLLRERRVSFQRTRTWKESKDPDKDAKLDRIEEVTSRFPNRLRGMRPALPGTGRG